MAKCIKHFIILLLFIHFKYNLVKCMLFLNTTSMMDLNMMNLGSNTDLQMLNMSNFNFDDYKSQPWIRNCTESTSPMTCKYYFLVEWFKTLSKACYDCPNNITDCFRPQCIAANGIDRVVMSVNRMLPGPLIQVCLHDTIDVVVRNNLRMGEGTSVHWHGIYQKNKNSQYMDGVGMITQCPINAKTSFRYNFPADQIGTYFWHSHVGIQRGDGFFGPLVIKHSNDVSATEYDFDLNEHIVVLNEWFDASVITKFVFNAHDGSTSTSGSKLTSILINGKGVSETLETKTPREIFKVKSGFRYRFRLIDAGVTYCPMQFSIDNHKLTVISTDGNSVMPTEVEAIVLYPERFDFILNAYQNVDNYWIKVKGLGDCQSNEVFQTAILNYEGIDVDVPNSLVEYSLIEENVKSLNNLNNYPSKDLIMIQDLQSRRSCNQPNEYYERIQQVPDKIFYFGMDLKAISNPEFNNPLFNPLFASPANQQFYTPQLNNLSFPMPPFTMLSQFEQIPKDMFCNSLNFKTACPQNITEYFCTCIHLIEADLNDLIEIVFVDENYTQLDLPTPVDHPMHIHGHAFAVVAQRRLPDSEPFSSVRIVQSYNEQGKILKNFNRPPLKDTIVTIDGGYTIIRLIADNPGIWMAHCHLDFHHDVGMVFMLKVGNSKNFPKKPKNWPLCGDYMNSN